MSKLKIYQFPDVVLAQKAKPVVRVEKALYSLADDMLETMYDAPGIGLAANQVGILQQILVLDTEYQLDESMLENEKNVLRNKKPKIIINPRIIRKEGKVLFSEACLSVPEYSAEVERVEKLRLQYQTIDGLTKTLDADGLLAIVIQHEMDHLYGKLFIDRLDPVLTAKAKKKLKYERLVREQARSSDSEEG